MLIKCEKMQNIEKLNMQNIEKFAGIHRAKPFINLEARINALNFFAQRKEATIEELAGYLGKNYTTALRLLKILTITYDVKLSRLESTSAKGKQKRYYAITIFGMITYLSYIDYIEDLPIATVVPQVAKVHSEMLLIFKKWDKFVQKGVETALIKNLSKAAKNSLGGIFSYRSILELVISDDNSIRLTFNEEKQQRDFNSQVLGFMHFLLNIDSAKEKLGKDWEMQQKIWQVVDADIDLKKAREMFIHEKEFEFTESLRTLREWHKRLNEQSAESL